MSFLSTPTLSFLNGLVLLFGQITEVSGPQQDLLLGRFVPEPVDSHAKLLRNPEAKQQPVVVSEFSRQNFSCLVLLLLPLRRR